MAKQKVALECLSYHATAPQELTVKLAKYETLSVETSWKKLSTFSFLSCTVSRSRVQRSINFTALNSSVSWNKVSVKTFSNNRPTDFELAEEETCHATIRMFIDFNLTSQFHIPYDVSSRSKPFSIFY